MIELMPGTLHARRAHPQARRTWTLARPTDRGNRGQQMLFRSHESGQRQGPSRLCGALHQRRDPARFLVRDASGHTETLLLANWKRECWTMSRNP